MMVKKNGERVVQGAYISVEAKDHLKKNYKKMNYHSPTEYAGNIIENHVKEEKDKVQDSE